MSQDKEMKYSDAMTELQNIVKRMQDSQIGVDDLATATRRALELLKICKEKLKTTDEEVKKCLAELSAPTA